MSHLSTFVAMPPTALALMWLIRQTRIDDVQVRWRHWIVRIRRA